MRRPPEPASISASTISSTRVPSVDPSTMQGLLDQEKNGMRRGQNISRAETQQPVARVDQSILAAVVGRPAFAMRRPVVLPCQALLRAIEVGSAPELPGAGVKRDLRLRSRQPGEDQETSPPRFPGALRGP